MDNKWHKYNSKDLEGTAPPRSLWHKPLWVVEVYYEEGITVGYFRGQHWEVEGSDDVGIVYWMEMEYPKGYPKGACE